MVQSHKSAWLVNLFFVIFLLCVLGAVLYVFRSNIEADLPISWKMYTDFKSGDSFLYPADYSVTSPGEGITDINSVSDPQGITDMKIQIQTNSDRANLAGTGQNYDLSQKAQQQKLIQSLSQRATINSTSYGKVIWLAIDPSPGPGEPTYTYYSFSTDNDTYFAILVWNQDQSPDTLQKFLSNFNPGNGKSN